MLWDALKPYKIILASVSHRRKELLQGLNLDFEVKTFPCEENYPDYLSNSEVAEYIASHKASVFPKEELPPDFLLITADTIVCIDGEILGKPIDEKDAIRMLEKLSGNKHEVITGVSILTANTKKTFSEKTNVYFKPLTSEEISFYVNNYNPFDKAGSYGIQEWIGFAAIERIDGSYFNVVGLPVQRLYEELSKI